MECSTSESPAPSGRGWLGARRPAAAPTAKPGTHGENNGDKMAAMEGPGVQSRDEEQGEVHLAVYPPCSTTPRTSPAGSWGAKFHHNPGPDPC